MPVILALGKYRQENREFEVSLGYNLSLRLDRLRVTLCQQQQNTTKEELGALDSGDHGLSFLQMAEQGAWH